MVTLKYIKASAIATFVMILLYPTKNTMFVIVLNPVAKHLQKQCTEYPRRIVHFFTVSTIKILHDFLDMQFILREKKFLNRVVFKQLSWFNEPLWPDAGPSIHIIFWLLLRKFTNRIFCRIKSHSSSSAWNLTSVFISSSQ